MKSNKEIEGFERAFSALSKTLILPSAGQHALIPLDILVLIDTVNLKH